MNPLFGRALGIFRANANSRPGGLLGQMQAPGAMPMQPEVPPTGGPGLLGAMRGRPTLPGAGGPLAMLRARIKRPGVMPMMQPPEMEPDQDESAMMPEKPGASY